MSSVAEPASDTAACPGYKGTDQLAGECAALEDAPSRFFYGYAMVPVATLVLVASTPGQTFGFAFFNEHLRAACGLSSTAIASVYLTATVLASLTVPWLGGLSDRIGLRNAIVLALVVMSLVCAIGASVSGVATLFLLFVLMRAVGPGWLTLLATNTMANWFDRRLGIASAATQIGMAVSIGIVPTVIVALIDQLGWRGAYLAIGAGCLGLLLPVVLLFYKEHPDDVGEVRDGRSARMRAALPAGDTTHRAYTLAQARSTTSYWLLLIAAGTWAAIGTGLIFHAGALFTEYGLGIKQATLAMNLLAIAMATMQLLGGVLADRLPGHWMVSGAVASIAASCLLIASFGRPALLLGFVIYGAAQGAMTIVISTVWARYYGRAHLGKIRGTSLTAAIGGSAIGPLLMGVSVDYFGGFTPSLWVMAAIATAVSVACLRAKDPGPSPPA